MSKKGRFVQMASQSAKNMLYCTCETGKLSGGAPGCIYNGVSLLGLSPRQEPPYGGCAPKHACGRRPAHTLHPQGVCSIRRAAKPLTAALPYRRGEFSTLSTDSFITLNGVVPILGQLHVYSGKIDICDCFATQKHRRMKNVRFLVPAGQPEMIHERFMHRLYAFLWRAAHV